MLKDKKRSERRYKDYIKAKKQYDIAKNHYSLPDVVIMGKYKKQHSLNCGRAGCLMCCNPRRTWGHITLKEEIAIIDFKEGLKEV